MPVRTHEQQKLAEARACLLGSQERLATFRRLGAINSNDRDLLANAVENFYAALDGVWTAQICCLIEIRDEERKKLVTLHARAA